MQVHPPADSRRELGSEPKTECWYVAHAEAGAELFVGLKKGSSRAAFRSGAGQRHRRGPNPSHRQCARATRCFCPAAACTPSARATSSSRSNRTATPLIAFSIGIAPRTDGAPRALHVAESLRSIDFRRLRAGAGRSQRRILSQRSAFRGREMEAQRRARSRAAGHVRHRGLPRRATSSAPAWNQGRANFFSFRRRSTRSHRSSRCAARPTLLACHGRRRLDVACRPEPARFGR